MAAWVWQGCHTLLICGHPCNLWENILRQKLLWVLWVLWEDSLVSAWVWQGCHTLLICAHPCNLWENILRQKLLWILWVLWEDSLVAAGVWQGCHTLLWFALFALLVQRRQLHPLERDSSKKVCGTITFLLLLHQTIRHDTLAYDRLNSIIVNK